MLNIQKREFLVIVLIISSIIIVSLLGYIFFYSKVTNNTKFLTPDDVNGLPLINSDPLENMENETKAGTSTEIDLTDDGSNHIEYPDWMEQPDFPGENVNEFEGQKIIYSTSTLDMTE